jgi:hypothetical protein
MSYAHPGHAVVAGSIPGDVTGIFIDLIFPAQLSLNRNDNHEYFLGGGKGGRCIGPTTLPLSYVDCLEIWEPQPVGTLRVFPGIALPLPHSHHFSYRKCWA